MMSTGHEAPLSIWKEGAVCYLPPRAADAPSRYEREMRDRQLDALARGITPVTDREEEAAGPRLDAGETRPAAFDTPPEIAAQLIELHRVCEAQRALERDEALELALERERDEKAAEAFRELEDLNALRESTYIRHVKNRAGEVISCEAYERSRDGREQLEEDSIDIVLRLESAGRPAVGSGPQPWFVDPISGFMKPLVNVRKRAIIPCAAAEKRAPIIAALELLLNRADHKFDQFCTFTSGKRVPLKASKPADFIGPDWPAGWHVREAFRDLHRALSKLNAEQFMRDAGARMIFRASEIGSLVNKETHAENRDEAGNWTLHPHAHCLIHFERFLTRQQMREWTRQVWAVWGSHWSIDGAIEKVREACKYAIKPADLKRLTTGELAALDAALFRLHRVQPLGDLKDGIRYRRENCLTVKRERRTRRNDGGERSCELVPVVLPDWNAQKKNRIPTPEEIARKKLKMERLEAKKAAEARALTEAELPESKGDSRQREMLQWNPEAGFERVLIADTAPVPQAAQPVPTRKAPTGERQAWQNRIVARLSPAPYVDRVATPGLLVWSDTRPDIEAIRAHPITAQIVAAAKEQVEKARSDVAAGRHPEAGKRRQPAGSDNESSHQSRNCPESFTIPEGSDFTIQRTAHLPGLLKPTTWQKAETEAAPTS